MMWTMITPQLTLLMTFDRNTAQFKTLSVSLTQPVEDRQGRISSCTLWQNQHIK